MKENDLGLNKLYRAKIKWMQIGVDMQARKTLVENEKSSTLHRRGKESWKYL